MTDTKKTYKRDYLIDIEHRMQSKWATEHVFECDASSSGQDKFMVTFPFPYMNGRLHLGHSFSLSKAEFAAGYERLKGKKVLFPFGFHCTGMPIKACADKLAHELASSSPSVASLHEATERLTIEKEENSETTTATATAKHSKVAAKTGNEISQSKILQSMGIPASDISKFIDPSHWLSYFPPLSKTDLSRLGIKVDWRRSFITTDVNPFYDSFIRWQFNLLKREDKIRFGKRACIYSPKDGQPCMDHDRASGEGVEPQEYTAIKFLVTVPSQKMLTCMKSMATIAENAKVYLIGATLRPETLYGMTNTWVGPEVEYGLYRVSQDEYWIMTARAARNMAYQSHFEDYGVVHEMGKLKGMDLIGTAVQAPMTSFPSIYVYPLMNVLTSKGTGIIASVPSDSPDDYAALKDLRDKPALRAKFNLSDDQVLPYTPIGIIQTEGYSSPFMAEILCTQYNVKSQNDRDGLLKAKNQAYKDGFYGGSMVVGPYTGLSVQEAKPLIKKKLSQDGEGFLYNEPENLVMSRSGDECVVAMVDQWYIIYGESEWKEKTKALVESMELYHPEVHTQMKNILEWLNQWACSRSYGLGSRLPWDKTYLIESLSDSTIYMAYYTVSHILHGGSFDGSVSPFGILPEQMTDDVWDYIFIDTCSVPPSDSTIPVKLLQRMKMEFNYFYPMDLRVSGKDLLFNHLTFMLYNHVAVWPLSKCPRGMRVNGHLLLNSQKMSKSTGNFMTLAEALDAFGADATRFTLADAGDTLDDANFLSETSNAAILKLYTQLDWIQSLLPSLPSGLDIQSFELTGKDIESFGFHEKVFYSQINRLVEAARVSYEKMLYRDALKYGFYELCNARDRYREVVSEEALNMNLLTYFVRLQSLVMSPIIPHFCEFIWSELFKSPITIMNQKWPTNGKFFDDVLIADAYLIELEHSLRLAKQTYLSAEQKKLSKKTGPPESASVQPPNCLELYIALDYPPWQQKILQILKAHYRSVDKTFDHEEQIIKDIQGAFDMKKDGKKAMGFCMEIKKQALLAAQPMTILERKVVLDEMKLLNEHKEMVKKDLALEKLTLRAANDDHALDKTKAALALPGEPTPYFYYEAL